jgi:hypothetical protein
MLKGKGMIIDNLQKITGKKARIGYINLLPLLKLRIDDLDIEGIAKIKEITVSPSLIYLFAGKIALNKVLILEPQITYVRKAAVEGQGEVFFGALSRNKDVKIRQGLVIKRLKIKNARINFTDYVSSEQGLEIMIRDVNFYLNNAYVFPASVITNFKLEGNIPWKEGEAEGKIEAEGWVDFNKKNMQAKLNISDIDGVYLYPYYSDWVDLDKARIEKATLNFTSDIQGLNNDITAQCHLELANMVRRALSDGEQSEKAARITDAVLDIFKALNQGNIVLDFTIKTKMDKPEFGFSNIKTAFEDKLNRSRGGSVKAEDVLMIPSRVLEGTVKSATNVTKSVIDGTFAIGNEIRKAVEGSFRKENSGSKDK